MPSGTDDTARFARELALLLGVPAQDGTLSAADLLTWGGALADANQTLTDVSAEFFAHLSTQLLSAWEIRVGLPVRPLAPTADRRAALWAKRSASGGDVLNRMRSAIRKIEPAANIVTVSPTNAADTSTPRQVFRFLVTLPEATLLDPAKMAAIRVVVDTMKPAYTGPTYATGRPFYLDVSKLDLTAL